MCDSNHLQIAWEICAPLVLASQSPRRKQLLSELGLVFDVQSPDVDEDARGLPQDIARALAVRKARAVVAPANAFVIAADTVVALEDAALGKPADAAQARSMLSMLSGREHRVYTGLCVREAATGGESSCAVMTRVRFRALTNAEIDAYALSGEPMDKAGAYAIQGGAAGFVESIEGEYDNVVGLPRAALVRMLSRWGAIRGRG